MMAADEDALVCDFAETYHIYDMRGLPAEKAAALAAGLRADTRIMMKIGGIKAPSDVIMLAGINDRLSQLIWLNTKDGAKGRNRPKLILQQLYEDDHSNIQEFDSGAFFEQERKKLIERINHGD